MIRHGHIKIISRDYMQKSILILRVILILIKIVFANISNYNSLTAVGMIFIYFDQYQSRYLVIELSSGWALAPI